MAKDAANRPANDDVEITREMVEVGEDVILGELGGAPIGGTFSPFDLARAVYSAMERSRRSKHQ